jgi:serine/threonine protein kinase
MVSYSEELTQERKMTEFTDFRNKISWDNIYDVYRFGKVIGNGKFGIVRLANSKIDPNLTFAIKSIYRRAFKEDQTEIKAELEVMRSVDHPNIVKLIEVYVDSEHVHLVMEHCSGGELFEMITTKGKFSEYDAKKLI